jgi:aryl sulfotransferase
VTETIAGPTKTRELHNHHFDSTIWNDLRFRDDDSIISTYAKSGTTWMQQIVAQLLFGPDPEIEVAEMSPWLDLRVPPKEVKLPMVEAQTHRRFLKTHLPLDALVFSPEAKYIYIGRDVVWSMYNHHANANEIWYEALNDTPGASGRPSSRLPATSGSTGGSGWTATAIPSGRSGRTCAPGGSSATCRISCSCTSRT